jgi:hypothetical protein
MTDFIQIIIGLTVLAHGLVHFMFEFYFQDSENNKNVGWSGESWYLSKYLDESSIRIIGRVLWALVIISFTLTGLILLGLPIFVDWWGLLMIMGSILSLIGFFLFWNGLKPEPFYYIFGLILDVGFLIFPFL